MIREELSPEDLSQNFILAAANGNLSRVQDLLSSNLVNVNTANQFGQTALIEVCKPRLSEALNPDFRAKSEAMTVARYLLDHGANPALVDNTGHGPIHYSVIHGRNDLVELLLNRDRELVNSRVQQWTPMFLAVYRNRFEVARTLIMNGSNVDEKMVVNNKEYSLADFTRRITNPTERQNMLDLINSQRTAFAITNASAASLLQREDRNRDV